jgi:hypothetical protein
LSTRNLDPEAEQEVDLGRYWSALVAHWWLPLAGFVIGAVVGYLISIGGKQVWNASSTVYLGASYSIVGGNLLQGPQANPSTVGTIAHAQDSLARAAAAAGLRPDDLHGNVSTKSIATGAGASTLRVTANPLVRLTVQASTRRKAQVAANTLSQIVVQRLAPFADNKIGALQARIDADQQQIDTIQRQERGSGDATAKAVFALHLGDVLDDQLQAKQLLIQAQEVERPKVLTRAAAVKTTARSRRNSVVVAAFLGLLLGVLAALLWEPLVRRRATR